MSNRFDARGGMGCRGGGGGLSDVWVCGSVGGGGIETGWGMGWEGGGGAGGRGGGGGRGIAADSKVIRYH